MFDFVMVDGGMAVEICEAIALVCIRVPVKDRVAIAKQARANAEEQGLSPASWSLRRLLTPTTLDADLRMAFDPEGEMRSTKQDDEAAQAP